MFSNLLHTKPNIFFVLLLLALATTINSAVLTGIVYQSQTGVPLENVMIEIKDGINGRDKTAFTDSMGIFLFDSLAPGLHNLHFYHSNTEPLSLSDIQVTTKEAHQLIVRLNPVISSLDKMIIHGRTFSRVSQKFVSTKTISRDEITRLPGFHTDVQRATQTLPNVSSSSDNTNEIIVRGGHQGENLLILDNIDIPNANIFAIQGWGGGLMSLVNPLQIDGLRFSAGVPAAMYGGKASSVLDIELRDGFSDVVNGALDIGVAGISYHIEGPMWERSAFMATVTKSFFDKFSGFSRNTAVPKYWNVQGKVTQILNNHKIKINGIYGDDKTIIKNAQKAIGTDGNIIETGGKTYISGITWDGYWGDRFSTTVTASATGIKYKQLELLDLKEAPRIKDTLFQNNSFEQEQTLKFNSTFNITNKAKIQTGLKFKRCDIDMDIFQKDDTVKNVITDSIYRINKSGIKKHDEAYEFGAYVSGILNFTEKLEIIPGIRYDNYTYNSSNVVSPRIGLVYALGPCFDITTAFGIQYQNPDYSDLFISPANKNLKPRQAISSTIGTEYTFEKIAAKLIIEGFLKRYRNLPIEASQITEFGMDKSDTLFSIGKGLSYGLELFFKKDLSKNFFCTFAYSHSRSEIDDFREKHKGEWLRADFDFRNAITITGGYKAELLQFNWYKNLKKRLWFKILSPISPFADRIELSAKWRFLGGRPYTNPVYDTAFQQWVYDSDKYNQSEYPDYHKLDLRLERRFAFDFFQVTYYLDFQNIYNRKNIWYYSHYKGNDTQSKICQLEFFPSGGIIIGF